jgi:ketosteroid isomerase-like protein
VQRLLEGISSLDIERVLDVLHDDLRFELMYLPTGGKSSVVTKDYLRTSLPDTLGRFTDWSIWMTSSYSTPNPEVIITEWESEGHLKSGAVYRNRYIGIQEIKDGKLFRWREYANPSPMVDVWPSGRPDFSKEAGG